MISKKLDFGEPSEAESAEAEPVSRNLFLELKTCI
jgi:hypothetical protein